MKLDIDGVEVVFPYAYIYPEQYAYMTDIKKTLDAQGPCLLEMPSGTGKTVSLLSIIVAYIQQLPEKRQLIYCSRTVPEIEKTLLELKRLMRYRKQFVGEEEFLGLGLASRKNLCIHPEVSKEKRGKQVDARCRNLTAGWIRKKILGPAANKSRKKKDDKDLDEHGVPAPGSAMRRAMARSERMDPDLEDLLEDQRKTVDPVEFASQSGDLCEFYENLEQADQSTVIPCGIYTLDDIREFGKKKTLCPYFVVRRMLGMCDVIVYSYHYLLDPKVAELVSKEMGKDSIVVFDEAHNIDNVCIESMSIDLNKPILEKSARCVTALMDKIEEIKQTDVDKLKDEYQKLVEGLKDTQDKRMADDIMVNPILPDDVLEEAVPGSIRRAEHFVMFMRRFVEYLKMRMKVLHVVAESPTSFLQHLKDVTCIEKKPLQFCAERLSMLMRTLELNDIDEFSSLQLVAGFASLVGSYAKGFTIILEPYEDDRATIPNPEMHLVCLDASLAISPVFKRFHTVVITSGTLSPLEMYPTMLQFQPVISKTYPMTLTRSSFCPLIITRGSDQVAVSSKFEVRNDPAVVRNYANILIEFSRIVPDGLVCFFPSYLYMESIVAMWNNMGILNEVWKYKLVFVETPDGGETSVALENYRKACDNGRGAVLLSVARGKVSEGIDFDNNYGRAVLMFGIPYQYTESRILKSRLEYLRDTYHIRENEFLTFDAIRHAAQCVGRVLRGKNDYGLMVFADKRYARADKRNKLPAWMNSGTKEGHVNLSTDMAVAVAERFLRQMAQPFDPLSQLGISLWSKDDIEKRRLDDKGEILMVNG